MRHDDVAPALGAKVRELRKERRLTRKQLAAAAGVSERYLHALENGMANVSIGILARIAQALATGFAELVLASAVGKDGAAPLRGASPIDSSLSRLVANMSAAEQQGAVPVLQRFLDEQRRRTRGIALLGLRGAGKTTLGRLFAERHRLPFVSITREIEARAGMSLADLFNLAGPDAYRGIENEVARDLATRQDRLVLETAGGLVGNPEAMSVILSAFRTVWLKATPEDHLQRVIEQGDMRPMRGNDRALEACLVEMEEMGLISPAPPPRRAHRVVSTVPQPGRALPDGASSA